MTMTDPFVAANRFGLGAGPGELAGIARDPRAWTVAQISPTAEVPAELASFPSSAEILRGIHEARIMGPRELRREVMRRYRETLIEEVAARVLAMSRSRVPFRERMVVFWSNHFTVSTTKRIIGPTIGAYEREAIRPNVFGRFEDLLLAVVHHPTMLSYLDNDLSIGPDSWVGRRSGRGLNENLAREILELHTLGVGGGYTQADVTEFARILTGWSHGGIRNERTIRRDGPVHGEFEFRHMFHEPGAKRLLGKRYDEDGENEGIAALRDLARHPSTARFIATKLVRHFVADDPPDGDVVRIARVFRDTGGDLAAVSRAVVALESAWRRPLAKFKTPYELVVSTLRALAVGRLPPRALFGSLRQLGQPTFSAPSPAGWPDRAADWASPEALMRRIEWVRAVAARAPRSLTPARVAEAEIGPVMAPATREMVEAAPSGEDALALILASPEFQRR